MDDAGRSVELPEPGSGEAVTAIDDRGEPFAILVHDEGLLADRRLVESVAAAARIAVANVRLQAEAPARADELDASRRRIVEAGDAQRRRLEEELRLGAERRLDVAALLGRARASDADGEAIEALEADLDGARESCASSRTACTRRRSPREGLMPALQMLAAALAGPGRADGRVGRLPGAVEAALFFVCSEALANAAKHASASRVSIELREERRGSSLEDDGIGGADLDAPARSARSRRPGRGARRRPQRREPTGAGDARRRRDPARLGAIAASR